MYEVIKFFTDLQDDCHHYEIGDSYPREGVTVSEKRIAQLAGSNNKQGVPLIKKVSGELGKLNEIAKKLTDAEAATSSVNPEEYKEVIEQEKPKPKRGRKPKAKEE